MSAKPSAETPNVAGLALPRHVAIIMDGNGRWAKKRLMPRVEGHRQGAKSVRMVVEESRRLGIRNLTLFTFSSENWRRPEEEVQALMRMLEQYLGSEIDLMLKNQVRLRAIGDLGRLSEEVQAALRRAIERTASMQGMDLTLALSYGGRAEITQAARRIAAQAKAGELPPENINEELFRNYLYEPELPDVDLLIRTSGENRISNFLLWQLAYAELVVTPVLWPDFSKEEYLRCLTDFAGRERRFGLTGEQL
ncbi:MAG: isoprenyl transferase [Deltaproteobacteria bacterium]|nr:isoprenyl transferase [Deltaproteobacteria bacterium]